MAAAQAQTASDTTAPDYLTTIPAGIFVRVARELSATETVHLRQLSRHSKQSVDTHEPSLSKIVLAQEESRLQGHFEYLTDLSKLGLNECGAKCINYYGPSLIGTPWLASRVVSRRASSWARARVEDENRTINRPYRYLTRLYDLYAIRDEVKRAQAFERANQDWRAGEMLAIDPISLLQRDTTHGDLTESSNFVLESRSFGQEPQDEQLLPFGSACRLLQTAFSTIQVSDLRNHDLFHCLSKKSYSTCWSGHFATGKF